MPASVIVITIIAFFRIIAEFVSKQFEFVKRIIAHFKRLCVAAAGKIAGSRERKAYGRKKTRAFKHKPSHSAAGSYTIQIGIQPYTFVLLSKNRQISYIVVCPITMCRKSFYNVWPDIL